MGPFYTVLTAERPETRSPKRLTLFVAFTLPEPPIA
jgi:hypothetical protein